MDNTLTVADVAKRLQLSNSTVYKYVEKGRIESLKIGGRRRILEEGLKKFLQSCQTHKEEGKIKHEN
jgi:excisionase family DNA binding protein